MISITRGDSSILVAFFKMFNASRKMMMFEEEEEVKTTEEEKNTEREGEEERKRENKSLADKCTHLSCRPFLYFIF